MCTSDAFSTRYRCRCRCYLCIFVRSSYVTVRTVSSRVGHFVRVYERRWVAKLRVRVCVVRVNRQTRRRRRWIFFHGRQSRNVRKTDLQKCLVTTTSTHRVLYPFLPAESTDPRTSPYHIQRTCKTTTRTRACVRVAHVVIISL